MKKMLKNYNQQQHKAFCVNVANVHVIPGKLFFVSKRVYSKFLVFFHFISLLKLSISGFSPPPQDKVAFCILTSCIRPDLPSRLLIMRSLWASIFQRIVLQKHPCQDQPSTLGFFSLLFNKIITLAEWVQQVHVLVLDDSLFFPMVFWGFKSQSGKVGSTQVPADLESSCCWFSLLHTAQVLDLES